MAPPDRVAALGLRQGRRRHRDARSSARAARRQDLRAVHSRPAHRSQPRRMAQPSVATHRSRPDVRVRHGPRNALQRRLLRLRLRPRRHDIWRSHGPRTGISRDEFDDYFGGATAAVAITLRELCRLARPLPLRELRNGREWFRPPQSFRYLSAGQAASFGVAASLTAPTPT
jgi:hypothetical protein